MQKALRDHGPFCKSVHELLVVAEKLPAAVPDVSELKNFMGQVLNQIDREGCALLAEITQTVPSIWSTSL